MKRAARVATAAAGLALLCSNAGFAQDRTTPYPRINIERFTLSPGAQDSLAVDTGALLPANTVNVFLATQYEGGPSVTRVGDEYASLRLSERILGHLGAAYAPAEWLQLELQLPVVFGQGETEALAQKGFAPVTGSGLATPIAGARVGLLRQDAGHPLSLALGANVGLPLGNAELLARDPQLPFRAGVSVGRSFGRVTVGGSVAMQLRSQENFGYRGVSPSELDTVDHEVSAGLSASGQILPRLRAELDVIGDFALENPGSTVQTLLGVRYQAAPAVEIFAAGGPAFGELVGTPQFRVLGGIGYRLGSASAAKRDEVRIAAVTKEAAPRAPWTEENQDLDSDADGVPDSKDACVHVVGEAHRAGCPLPDKDGDGVGDDVDLCPAERGVAAAGGCPERDTDRDGVADRIDLCPRKAGNADPENPGCPDTDGDSIADNRDNCVAEVGPKENHGCPAREKQLVVIEKEKLRILDNVYFRNGKAQLLPKSQVLLDQVARILIEHPEIEKIVVEGHTDNRGNDRANLQLSQQRADAVRAYLVKAGVAPYRIEARGHGEEKPLLPNDTAANREANRRVEFVIGDGAVDTELIAPLSGP